MIIHHRYVVLFAPFKPNTTCSVKDSAISLTWNYPITV